MGINEGKATFAMGEEEYSLWRPIAEWLPRGNSQELVYLTKKGRKRFVVVPLDEMDEEILAMRKNAAMMAHIDKLSERARKGLTKRLAEIKRNMESRRRVRARANGGVEIENTPLTTNSS